MQQPIRPAVAFVLRLWQEPGARQEDARWRGLVWSLEASANQARAFDGLDTLPEVLRALLGEGAVPHRDDGS